MSRCFPTRAALAFALALFMASTVVAQVKEIKDPRVQPTVLQPDKIRVERFDATPNPLPVAAQATSVTFVGRNISLGPLSIPWRINNGAVVWQSGVEANVPAGRTFSKTFPLTMTVPQSTLELRLDPNKTLGEFGIHELANNEARLVVKRVVPGTRQLVLNAQRARGLGANFSMTPDRGPGGVTVPCDCGTRRWFDPSDPLDSQMTLHNEVPSAYFRLICKGGTGGKMEAQAFGNIRLKNGYKVVNVRFDQTSNGSDAGFSTLETPVTGSDNPTTRIHVWGNRGANFEVWLKIVVEGPADKEPF